MNDALEGRAPFGDRVRSGILLLLCGAVLAMLLLQAGLHTALASRNIGAYGDVTYPESSVVERTMGLIQGRALYDKAIYRWPYQVSIYGPMTYYPVAALVRAEGPERERFYLAHQVYITGRMVSFVAGMFILLWIWAMGGLAGLHGLWRILPVLFFFSSFRVIEMWSSFRPDFPMLALGLWGWYFALRFRRIIGPVLAAIFFGLAISYKHTCALSAFSLFVWLLADRRFRDAVCFAAVFGLLAGGEFITLQILTDGAWYLNTVKALQSPWFFPATYSLLFLLSVAEMIPLAGGFAAIVASRAVPAARPLCWAFGLSFLMSELTLARAGSNLYYYLEPYCWGTILAAVVLRAARPERLPRVSRLADAIGPAGILLIALLAVPFASMALGFIKTLPQQYRPQPNLYQTHPELARILENTHGDVLLSEGSLAFYTKAPPTLMDPILLSAWTESGNPHSEDLLRKIREKQFEIVVLTWDVRDPVPVYESLPFQPQEAVAVLRENYEVLRTYREYFLCTPLP